MARRVPQTRVLERDPAPAWGAELVFEGSPGELAGHGAVVEAWDYDVLVGNERVGAGEVAVDVAALAATGEWRPVTVRLARAPGGGGGDGGVHNRIGGGGGGEPEVDISLHATFDVS